LLGRVCPCRQAIPPDFKTLYRAARDGDDDLTNSNHHQALYRNTALELSGFLVLLALLTAAITLTLKLAQDGEAVIRGVLGSLGVFVLLFIVLVLIGLRRHGWTIEPGHVLIQERPAVPFTGRRRAIRLPFGDVVRLARVQNGVEDVIELRARSGARYLLSPVARAAGRLPVYDSGDLEAFAARLHAAILAAGHALPALADGMSFWNRPAGLGLLGVLLVLSLGISGMVLVGILGGGVSAKAGSEAAAILVLLPVGVGWAVRRAWRRRRALLAQGG
jgi:hypothetical protein